MANKIKTKTSTKKKSNTQKIKRMQTAEGWRRTVKKIAEERKKKS